MQGRHQSRYFVWKSYYLHLFDKLLTCYCTSSFWICIVFVSYFYRIIKIIHSQKHPSTAKSVVLGSFYDFSAEILSSTEVAKYLDFGSSNWKHLLLKNFIVGMCWWVPSQIVFWVLSPIHLLLKYFDWWKLFRMPCPSCGIVFQYLQ